MVVQGLMLFSRLRTMSQLTLRPSKNTDTIWDIFAYICVRHLYDCYAFSLDSQEIRKIDMDSESPSTYNRFHTQS